MNEASKKPFPPREGSNCTPETENNFLVQQIIDAIQSDDLEKLINSIELMNAYLTSHSKLSLPDQVRRQKDELEDFLKRIKSSAGNFAEVYVYLGDGGVSRLIIKVEDNKINFAIGDVSTNEVKEKWLRLQ